MFVTPLRVEAVHSGHWRLIDVLVWEGKERIIVPVGFVTDLASVPPAFHGLIPIDGRSRRPAALHDFLYAHGEMPRSRADDIFLEALIAEGVQPKVARGVFWRAVRKGGRRFWRKLRGNNT